MLPRRGRLHAAAVALVAGSIACASASFDGSLFQGRGVAFRIAPVPPSWHRLDVADSDLAFRDDAHEASILVNSRCSSTDRDAPLVALGGHLIMGTTDRQVKTEEVVPFDGREAFHTMLTARLDGVPMAYDIYVLKKDGCVYDLVYLTVPGPSSISADAGTAVSSSPPSPEFSQFVRGFHTASPSSPSQGAGS
jgi:hypothetical protein